MFFQGDLDTRVILGLFLKYEDLIKDTKSTLISILNFLSNLIDIKIDEKKITNTVNSCSFETLQKKEQIEGFFESVSLEKDANKKIIIKK